MVHGEDSETDEQADLLTFEEGLTGHPLQGDVYVCVNRPRPGAPTVEAGE